MQTRKGLFLDRDGVINVDHGYVSNPANVVFCEGIFELCNVAVAAGYTLVCVTNQSGVGRGYFSITDMQMVNDYIRRRLLREAFGAFVHFYCATVAPSNVISDFSHTGLLRKPFDGMFQRASRELNLDVEKSVMIGDRLSDMYAAHAAGVKWRYLLSPKSDQITVCRACCEPVASLGAVTEILKRQKR